MDIQQPEVMSNKPAEGISPIRENVQQVTSRPREVENQAPTKEALRTRIDGLVSNLNAMVNSAVESGRSDLQIRKDISETLQTKLNMAKDKLNRDLDSVELRNTEANLNAVDKWLTVLGQEFILESDLKKVLDEAKKPEFVI